MLCGLAEATSRVELGMMVMCIALRKPVLLAKMAITADEVSGGRIILGLGAGWNQPAFEAFGIPFDHLASRFEEAMKIINPLLKRGQGRLHGQVLQCARLGDAPTRAAPRGSADPDRLVGPANVAADGAVRRPVEHRLAGQADVVPGTR